MLRKSTLCILVYKLLFLYLFIKVNYTSLKPIPLQIFVSKQQSYGIHSARPVWDCNGISSEKLFDDWRFKNKWRYTIIDHNSSSCMIHCSMAIHIWRHKKAPNSTCHKFLYHSDRYHILIILSMRTPPPTVEDYVKMLKK